MKSQLKQLKEEMRRQEDELRATCPHNTNWIKIKEDHSVVGCGSGHPSVHVVCRNCGTKKIIFRTDEEMKKKVGKTLGKQGFKDERLDCYVQYEHELE